MSCLLMLFLLHRPCILIFDSLAGASRSRVVATLRDYLTCEYKAKNTASAPHTFTKDTIPGHSVKVPQQNNFTDCGLYLLQYVEHFYRVSERLVNGFYCIFLAILHQFKTWTVYNIVLAAASISSVKSYVNQLL